MKAFRIFLLFLPLVLTAADDKEWLIKQEFLSAQVEDFDCHGSGLIETAPGRLCAVWKGGPGKGKSNIDIKENIGIWESLFDGSEWSEPKEIVTAPHSVCWTPVLCKLPSGELLLFYRIGLDPRIVVSFVKRSQDNGISWSEPEILPAGIIGPTNAKLIVTSEGVIIAPSSVEVGHPKEEYKATACWIEISEDQGKNWKKYGPIEIPGQRFGVIEPSLFFDAEGHLKLFCRDRSLRVGLTGYIWTASSEDLGKSWSELKPTVLPNPDSGISVVDLGQGKIGLVYNHSHTNRYPLNLALSSDSGETWSEPIVIESTSGEFPTAIVSSDGTLHITYAWAPSAQDQRRIKHVVINLNKIE